ncbi:MAG: sulfite exporter TauE/SafE family protein [Proteobacteria bacterium]|nr:hypothetical protein [Desulfobulbaceae bacterium]MBU4152946.1 sulfite exporter TauE/SafE family protein [Pseudomonadota bacterium]MDP2107348.1 sulfite exporter TauE/SafE family protein [Desulfobulbaceae bacterium]
MMPQDIMLYFGAIALGALHAFEPGHGKTLIAAYMIGTRGRAMDGVLLGLIVTFTHTFSVIMLGIIAKALSHTYTETQLHAWLGLGSSILILIVGIWMLTQRLGGQGGHHSHLFGHGGHGHGHGHGHSHGPSLAHDHGKDEHQRHSSDLEHDHGHDQKPSIEVGGGRATEKQAYKKWNLLILGISGGLVPCPAAIATLLAAIAAGRIAQGLTMAIFFSVGLGVVMMTIGVVLSHAGRLTEQIAANQEFGRRMGIVSAVVITVLGAYTLYHSIQGLAGL